jgi:pSer/pThr/pTyr-binding forkhead associated (FHA) protein
MAQDKGLICEIFKSRYQSSSNGGLSEHHEEVTLIGIDCDVFGVRPHRPAVRLVYRDLGGKYGRYVHAEPVEQPSGGCGPMFGGTYICTSDSRFPSPYPIPLHDRWE